MPDESQHLSGDAGAALTTSSALRDVLRDVARTPDGARVDGSMPAALGPGDCIGRFQIVRLVGEGGFGTVYQARDTELGRQVAIKLVKPWRLERRGPAGLLELFRHEAAAAARLNHPGIITVHDFGTHEGAPYLVLELLEGETLAARLARGPLPASEAVATVVAMCRALVHAHAAGVIHRDLKPANVFLRDDGQITILDFGLARVTGRQPHGGTPAYMAPEQRRGEDEDARTDVYACGVVLHELLSGTRPPPVRLPAVSPELVAIVERALAADRADRYPGARALLDALLALDESGRSGGQPYRFLDPFTEADADWFFGREREAARLHQMVATRAVVALVGSSGAGKSSLVHAGLLPRLRRGREWTVVSMRPGSDPLGRLHARLAETCGAERVLALVPDAATLAGAPGRAGTLLREHAACTGGSVLFFVDQLEELLAQGAPAAAQRAFIAALLGAADDDAGRVRCVVALRDDFLGRLSTHPELREALARSMLLLGPPNPAALAEALRRPAERLGFEYEATLSEQMLAAVTGEAAPLPLLQLAASRLWERRDADRRLLSRAALEAAGGVGGIFAALAGEILKTLDEDEAVLARRLLCDLVTAEGTRRRARRDDLCGRYADAERVVERMVAGRLLTSYRDEGGEHVELAHESLISGWARLRGWLDEDRVDRRLHERVSDAASRWAEGKRAKELLWRGATLEEALHWRRRDPRPLAPEEHAFLAESDAGMRHARRLRGGLVAGATLLAIVASATAVVTVRASRETARQGRLREMMRAAAREDPLVGALLLAELRGQPEPPGGLAAAAQVAAQPIPLVVYRSTRPLIVGAFSPDGAWAAVTGAGETRGDVILFRTDGSGAPIALRGHWHYVEDLRFDRDGTRVATAGNDATARIWRADGNDAPIILPHGGPVESVAFSPDGVHLLTVASGNAAHLWPSDGRGAPVVLAHEGRVAAASFDRDGRRIVSAGRDGIRVWNAEGAPLHFAPGEVGGAVFSPDGSRILSIGRELRVWRADLSSSIVLPGALPLQGERAPQAEIVFPALWSADGQRVAHRTVRGAGVSHADGSGVVFEIDRRSKGPNLMVRFSPDGARLLVAEDDAIRVWPADGRGEPIVLRGHASPPVGYFSADGSRVLTVANDATARVWRLADAPGLRSFLAETRITGVAWSPDGQHLLTTHVDGTAQLRPMAGGAPVILGTPGKVVASGGAVHPDGTRVALSRNDGLEVWSVAGPTRISRSLAGVPVGSTAWSPDGAWLAAESGWTGPLFTVSVFHADGSPAAERRISDIPWFVAFSPDGSRLVVASFLGGRVWPRDLGGEPVMLPAVAGLRHAVFRPSGELIMTNSGAGRLQFWTPDGKELLELARAGGGPPAWSHDGERVAVGRRDGSVHVTRLDGRGEPVMLLGHESSVAGVAFHPDGRLATAAGRTVRLWQLDWQTLTSSLRAATTACLIPEQRVAHLGEASDRARAAWDACERRYGRAH